MRAPEKGVRASSSEQSGTSSRAHVLSAIRVGAAIWGPWYTDESVRLADFLRILFDSRFRKVVLLGGSRGWRRVVFDAPCCNVRVLVSQSILNTNVL